MRHIPALVALIATPLFAATPATHPSFLDSAPTPPMGWNSWDCWGTQVTAAQVRANADYMADHLEPFGWHTAR